VKKINWGLIAVLFAFFLAFSCGAAKVIEAQEKAQTNPQLQVFVDTAGIVAISPPELPATHTSYLTWVFAKAGPGAYPSSGILVAFDCTGHKVRRISHVVYKMNDTNTGVTGDIVDDDSGWVEMTDPRLMTIVCSIGKAHSAQRQPWRPTPTDTTKTPKPKSPYSEV
jgi:hypothetical protein